MFAHLTKTIDRILHGEITHSETGKNTGIGLAIRDLALLILILGGLSGLGIGSYSALRTLFIDEESNGWALMQSISSGLKIPLLFLTTLFVTMPSLYVFNALAGSHLKIDTVLRLLMSMMTVTLVVMCSLVPIIMFFSLSTPNYYFIKLLTVAACMLGGILGLFFMRRTLKDLKRRETTKITSQEISQETLEDITRELKQYVPRMIFGTWILAFALVGMQMSWLMRPFIGRAGEEFSWFRAPESNFFINVVRSIGKTFGA
ncbi:MAG: hypothetical protein CMJ53_04665 [Planctomycetaceae bacterium]|nr:hypothetical protein [Planctomycetaceae bacterium]|tara:strand:- start:985 stop:1764 length:780 start_codon:yes stop_codon:yes gene_type:complete